MCVHACGGGWGCYMLLGEIHSAAIKQRRLMKYFDFPHFAKRPFNIEFLAGFVFQHTHPMQPTPGPRAISVFGRDQVHFSP